MIVGEEEITIKKLYLILMKHQFGNAKECKTLIKHHKVMINDVIMDDPDYIVEENDKIRVNGLPINSHPFIYYMMNKPKGYICANKDQIHRCVIDLIDKKDCFCIGRLDKDTTGLLLITNDSSLMKKLLLPNRHVKKTYLVEVNNILKRELVDLFQQGVVIDRKKLCLPAYLEIIDDVHCYVTIYEGRYHQIKKMFLSCGYQVVELKRINFAGIALNDSLHEGQYRCLHQKELQILKKQMLQ